MRRKNSKTYARGKSLIGTPLLHERIDILGEVFYKDDLKVTRFDTKVIKSIYASLRVFCMSDTYRTGSIEYVKQYTHEFTVWDTEMKLEWIVRFNGFDYKIVEIKKSDCKRYLYIKCKGVETHG